MLLRNFLGKRPFVIALLWLFTTVKWPCYLHFGVVAYRRFDCNLIRNSYSITCMLQLLKEYAFFYCIHVLAQKHELRSIVLQRLIMCIIMPFLVTIPPIQKSVEWRHKPKYSMYRIVLNKFRHLSTLGTRGFSRVQRKSLVLAEGRHIFGLRLKPRSI